MGTIECDKSTVTPMLVLSNVMMNYQMWKKNNNGPTKCEKSTVISNVGITQCDDEIVKTWRKKIIVPPNVTKVWLEVMLVLPNVTIELSNVRKKIGYHQMCDKSTIRSDVGTIQCDNWTIQCDKSVVYIGTYMDRL